MHSKKDNTALLTASILIIAVTVFAALTFSGGEDTYIFLDKTPNYDVIELNTTILNECNETTEGYIQYNGTSHYACNGSDWNAIY